MASGKTREKAAAGGGDGCSRPEKDVEAQMIARAREVLVMLLDNADVIRYASGEEELEAALVVLEAEDALRKGFFETFGIPVSYAKLLLNRGGHQRRSFVPLPRLRG